MGVEERYKKKTEEKKAGTLYNGVENRYLSKNVESVGKEISNRVNTWLENNKTYFSNAQKRFSGENAAYRTDTTDWLATVSKQRENFQKEAESIKSVLNQYKDVFGQEYVNSVYEALDGNLKAQESIIEASNKDIEYWSQWANEDEYKTAVRYDGYQKKYAGKSYDEVLSLLGQLQDGEEKEWLNANKYDFLANEADFKEYSQKGASIVNPSYEDAEGWINIFGWRPGAEDVGNIVTYSRDNAAAIGLGGLYSNSSVGDFRYSLMTDSEVNAYNYYLGKYGEEKASEFLASIDDELTKRYESGMKEGMKHVADTAPVLSSAISPVMSVFSGAEYLSDLVTGDDRNLMADFNTIIRGTVSEKVDWEIGNWDAFDFVYNTGMSMADSIVSTTLLGGAGGVSLGLSAAAQATNDALDRGLTKEQAFWNGISAGVFEGLFETVSIGNFQALKEVSAKSVKDIAKNIGKSMLVNASEEALTEIANITYDLIANGDLSNFDINVRYYMEQGMSEAEAKHQAAVDLAHQVVESAASGAFMGVGMGGIATAGSSINSAIQGADMKKNFGSGIGASLTAEALEIDPSNPYAQKMQSKLDSGKTLSNRQVGNLMRQNETAMYENDVASIQNAVESRLAELGEKGDVKALAKAITKKAVGEGRNVADITRTLVSEYGRSVAKDLNAKNIRAGKTNDWTGKIGTDRINAEEYGRLLQSLEAEPATAEATAANEPETAQPAEVVAEIEDVATQETAGETQTVSAPENVTAEETATEAPTEATEAKDAPVTLESESKKYGAQAGAMMHTYNEGQNVVEYDAAYSAAYEMGKSGVNLSYAMQSESTAYLTEEQRKLAHAAGVDASNATAKAKDTQNKEKINGKTGRRKGVVKGRDVSIADLKKAFNDTQGKAYKLLSTYAEVTGVDIVLYNSEANADGRFVDAQGLFKWSEDTIYIDINAGLKTIKNVGDLMDYTMMRTFSHEFSHFIEKWNPIWYNEFRKVVFDTMTERGENVDELIKAKMEQNEGMSYDKASREVVAEAMVDILPDANFVEELATKHKNIFAKLLEMLKEFVADLKAHFASLEKNSPREANALKEQIGDSIKYVESIVKLFDKIAVEAVENYQATVATEEVVEAPAKVGATAETEADGSEFTITDNREYGTLEIKFDGKPSEAVRDALKEQGFRWHRAKQIWYGKGDRADIVKALREAYQSETTAEETSPAVENKSDFAKAFENATQAERDEVVEAINANTKLSHMAPTEIRETQPSEVVESKEIEAETVSEQTEAPAAKQSPEEVEKEYKKNFSPWLKRATKKYAMRYNGGVYLSDGSFGLKATDELLGLARTEFFGQIYETALPDPATKALNNANTLITDAPIEGTTVEGKTVYVFDLDGKTKAAYDKKYLSKLDGNRFYIGDFMKDAKILKAVDADGNVVGFLLPVRLNADVTNTKPSKLKSFSNKMQSQIAKQEVKPNVENADNQGTVLEPDTDRAGTARPLDEGQAEDVRGAGTDGQPVEPDREEGSGAGRHDSRTDPVSGDRGSDGDGESRDLRNDGLKTHAEAKAYAEEKGYRIELNKLAAKKNIIQVDIYDKQGLPTFNPVIIGELGKTKDGSGWNKVKEAIDKREAADNSAADTNVGDKLHEETAEQTEELTEMVEREIAQKSTVEPKGSNFVIGDSLDLPNGDKARHRANVDAIRLIKQLETEGRYATAEEQQVLSKYVGWGGLANAFGEMLYNRETRKSEMTAKKGWEKEFAELRSLVDEGIITEQEYKDMSASTKNAHYTSVEVIKAMYDGLASLGFKGGSMLEPSSGVGNFVGAMPAAMSEKVNSWTMVELDRITGQIAKYLYPNADVRIQGFETANIPDNYMDVAIGNVPFGNFGVVDRSYPKRITKSIHNYFFAKSLDKVRPGGIVMFITSSFTMDSSDSAVRKYIMERADLLGAIRLPNTAFEENAGTEVVTDILVLKKRKSGTEYSGEDFLEAEYKYQYGTHVSGYFEKHPEMVLGKAVTKRGMYGANTLTYEPHTDKGTIGEQIREAFKNIKGEMSYPEKLSREKTNFAVERANKKTKSGGLVVNSDGSISRNENGTLVKVDADEKTAKRIAGMLSIRDAYRKLASYLQQGLVEGEIKKARKELNAAYDKFVKEYGYLNAPANKRAINSDPDRYSIYSLEHYDEKKKTAKKADIFTKDTISANKTVVHVGSVEEGVIASINLTGGVDADLVAKLTDKTVEDVTRDIIDARLAFKTRGGGLVAREAYLSGNVRAKLREAEALVPYDADYSNNVEELSRIIPADIPYNEIYITPGSTFIPNEVYADFIAYMLGGRNNNYYGSPDVEVGRSASGEFKIVLNNKRLKGNYRNNQEWGTARKSFLDLIDAMMGSRTVRVNDMIENPDGKKISVINEAETEAANEKVKAIQKEFEEWVWKDEDRRNALAKLYNETFNALVNPKYDGSSLSVNGINPTYSLMEHQANAVHRVVSSGGNTLLAHRVGAGKTLEMAAAAMKLRELGVVKKPVFVVPKNVVAQWGVEFNNYFPAAKLLVADDKSFTPANRKVFTNMIANGDYDAVIVTYEQFEKIPMSAEYQAKFYEEQIDEIITAIAEEKAESRDGKGLTVKEMEKKKAQLEKKLKELTSKPKDEDNIDFEMLGIDSLFVDEAHNFKNLEYVSKMTNVAGLGSAKGAQRAFDLYTKIRYLQGLNGGRGIVFATATPVMNSMVELYIMQKYLQPDVLNQLGLKSFDAWAKQFGEVVNKWEINPSGTGMRQKQVFANFRNLNELQLLFRSFTDVVTELPYLKIPKMKGGAVKIVECEPGEFQRNYMKALQKRAENVKNVDPSEDNMLKITSDGRKVSYTQRMIDPTLPYEPDCKIFRAGDNIVKEYQESADVKGTQIVFLDMATPKGTDKSKAEVAESENSETSYDEGSAKLYEDMRNYLVKKGIPKREIAFIHEADTDAKRTQLFEDVNEGKVRVLIGSTGKMGVGMNAQKRVVAIHHLDAPWRPGDVEQRDGRAFRQKNINEEVSKYVYVTKGSFDSRLWDILDRKQHFISQIMNGEDVGRTAEDTGEVTLSAAEVKALASGNPLIEEQTKLTDEIKKLENLQKAHSSSMRLAKTKLSDDITKIANYESSIEKIREDISARKDTYSDGKFSMNIGGKQFTDKKEAGVALAAEITAKASKEAYVTVAKFAGFELRVIRDLAEYKGVIHGKENYKFNVYMNNTTRMVNHIGEVIAGFENMIESQKRMIAEATVDRDAQQKILAQPFEKQAELAEKRARFNEVMELLAPKNEEQLGKTDEDTVQEQSRKYLEEEKPKKQGKRSKHSETETLFMIWAYGSAPVGEVKRFVRFGKHRYFEKTEDGYVELSREQYNERVGYYAEDIIRRAKRGISKTADFDGRFEGSTIGSVDSDRNAAGASAVSKQTFGEKLRNDVSGSVSSFGGGSRRATMTASRIDYLIADSGAGMRKDYAQSWITSINPTDFLNLTLMKSNQNRELFDNMPGDYGSTVNNYDFIEGGLKKEKRQTPYLAIDVDTGEVVGHEGRHRMRALEKEGVTYAEIKIEFRDSDGRLVKEKNGYGNPLEPIDSLEIFNQRGTGQSAIIRNIIPLNEANRDNIIRHYGAANSDDIQYQQRTTALNDREVLAVAADALEETELTDAERDALKIFKSRLSRLEGLQEDRLEQGKLYKEQQFGEKVDREAAKQTLNRMQVLDDQIKKAKADVLSLEDKEVLGSLLKKARKVVEAEQRKHDADIMKRYREREKEAVAVKKYRNRILSDRNDLIEWLNHPMDKNVTKHVNENVKDVVIDFLLSIDPSSVQKIKRGVATRADLKHDEQARKLLAMLNNLDEETRYSGEYDLPLNFESRLKGHIETVTKLAGGQGDMVLNSMNSEELKELSVLTANLKTALKTMNKFHANAMFAHVTAAGDNTVNHLKALHDSDGNAFENFTMWKSIRPDYVWSRFGEGGRSIGLELRKGQNKLGWNAKTIIDFAQATFTEKECEEWENKSVEVTLSDGRKIKATAAALMSFYELSKRKQGRKHILDGGVTVSDVEIRENKKKQRIKGRYGKFTETDIDIMNSKLTARQKEVADKLQQFMEKQGGEWGNHVTLARFGEKAFGEAGYFPISVDKQSLSANNTDKEVKGADLYRLLNMGFTKELSSNTKQPLMLYSIFDVFSTHMADMAQYNAMALPVLDAIRWLNYKNIDLELGVEKSNLRAELRRAFGAPVGKNGEQLAGYAESFITHILQAYNGTEARGTPEDAWGVGFMHRYNRAQIAYNMRVVVQQPMALTRAALVIKPKYIAKALDPTKLKANIKDMLEHSGIAVWKDLGYYDINISRGLTQMIKQDETWLDKVTEIGMKPAELADKATWAVMWYACKLQLAEQGITDYERINALFDDVIYKTQVVDSVLTKSQYMRDKGFLARTTSAFMSEAVTTASMVLGTYDEFRMDMRKGASAGQAWRAHKNDIGRTVLVYSVSAILLSMVQAVADAFRDDDDYEEWYEKWLEAFGGNVLDEIVPLNKLPLVSYLWDTMKIALDIFTDLDVYGNPPESALTQWVDTLRKAWEITSDLAKGEGNYTLYAAIYKYLQVASGASGLPVSAGFREVATVWNNTVGVLYPDLKWKSYDSGDKNEIKYAYQDGYLTDEEATELLLEQGLVDNENEAYFTVQGWEVGEGYNRYEKVYEAVRTGTSIDEAMKELLSHGYTEKDVIKQVKTEIGKWYRDGEVSKQQATDMLTKYTEMSDEEITKLVNQWSAVVVTGIEYDDIDDEFMDGKITASRAIEMYVRYGGMTKEDATEKVTALSFVKDHPSLEGESVSYKFVTAYNEYCEPKGIDVNLFHEVWQYKGSATADIDKRGEIIPDSAKKKVLAYIDELDLSRKQKDSLYYALGYAKSTIKDAPWR